MSSSISRRSGRLATANLKLMNSSKLREVTVDVDNFSSIHSATKTARVQRSSQLERKPEEQRPENCPRVSSEWKFGAHVSSAGGVENAVINAAEIGYVLSFVVQSNPGSICVDVLKSQLICSIP